MRRESPRVDDFVSQNLLVASDEKQRGKPSQVRSAMTYEWMGYQIVWHVKLDLGVHAESFFAGDF